MTNDVQNSQTNSSLFSHVTALQPKSQQFQLNRAGTYRHYSLGGGRDVTGYITVYRYAFKIFSVRGGVGCERGVLNFIRVVE